MNKIKAFTILEVTIAMLISALVIGIVYLSYSIVVKSYISFSNKNNDIETLLNLDRVIKRDFERSKIVLKDTAGVTCLNDSSVVKYDFGRDYIVRKSVRADTFKVQAQEIITNFQNIPVAELNMQKEQNRIDELSFTLLFKSKKIPYNYRKLYSSADLIERNPNAIN